MFTEMVDADVLETLDIKLDLMPNCSIRNLNFEDFLNLFHTSSLDISKFWLINAGYDISGVKQFTHLIIRACQIRPFLGPHLVTVRLKSGELETFWVNSLTFIRRTIFKFTDRLSFERSTYLIPFDNGELLIRIKSIRSLLHIPQMDWAVKIPKIVSEIEMDSPKKVKKVKLNDKNENDNVETNNNFKASQILNTYMQTMITFISRERNLNALESVEIVKKYANDFCTDLSLKLEDAQKV